MTASSLSLEATVAAHGARIDAQHERQNAQDDAIGRLGKKIDYLLFICVSGLGAAIFNVLKH